MAIAAGEYCWSAFDARRLLEAGAVDVLQLEDIISEQVAAALLPHLSGDERMKLHKRGTDDAGRGVDRRPDREVDDAAGMGPSPRGVRRQQVPGEVRQQQPIGRCAGPTAQSPAQCSCSCGGSAVMSGWSLGMSPSLAAPPGEPRSSKNSTFAL